VSSPRKPRWTSKSRRRRRRATRQAR
jgi:hypothetical protein